jgi:flavin reductase (DIM6/NTAB) family NADH-FMN oxidoreductase RutF
MPVDIDLFRAIVGSFPTGVTVVTTLAEDGTPRGLTSNAFSSISADPPLLMVSVDKRSNTLESLQSRKAFVVNFLAAGRADLSNKFASREPDKFAGINWVPSQHADGSPILAEDSIAYAECTTYQAIDAGDHWIFLGHIEGGSTSDGDPLTYFRRGYSSWAAAAPTG